jgi:hypothetical protein
VYGSKTRSVARVHDLLRRVGIEVDGRLAAQDQDRIATCGQLECFSQIARDINGIVWARGYANAAPNAGFLDDPGDRAIYGHGTHGADPNTGQARNAIVFFELE